MKRLLVVALFAVALAIFTNPLIDYLNRQAPIDPNKVSYEYNPKATEARFHGYSFSVPSYQALDTQSLLQQNSVLSSESDKNKEKYIEVDLTNQKVYAFEGGKKVYDFLVSTGKWGPTPTGEFHIWTKLKYALMTGGSTALNTYYYLPNVPYTMYFYGDGISKSRGYSLHGTYWHDNFGHPMSHGCVNMKTEEAKLVFNWAASEQEGGAGTKIVIYGTTPKD